MLTDRERVAARPLQAAAPDPAPREGMLVSIPVPEAVASRLAVPDGEPPEALHVTVCYVGGAADLAEEVIEDAVAAVEEVVVRTKPFTMAIVGAGRFEATPQSEGRDVWYAAIESRELLALRDAVARALTEAGAAPNNDFEYHPHITLQYVPPGTPLTLTVPELDPIPVTKVEVRTPAWVQAIPVGRQWEREALALERLSRLPVIAGPGQVPTVRATDVLAQPVAAIEVPLNGKTTANEVRRVRLEALAPSRPLIPLEGLRRYVTQPRRDPPDVAEVTGPSGTRYVIQEGHTRVAAARLRDEPDMEVRVWRFVMGPDGRIEPVARGRHRRGLEAQQLSYREKLRAYLLEAKYPPRAGEGTRRAIDEGRRTWGERKFREREAWEREAARERRQAAMERMRERARRLSEEELEEELITLPDIADVKGPPSVVGAIPAKRRRTVWRGVVLGRRPTEFEAYVLSLTAIPRRYDAELERVVRELEAVRRAHAQAWLQGEAEADERARSETEAVIEAAQERMGRYGIVELRRECQRQGLALTERAEEDESLATFVRVPVLEESRRVMTDRLQGEWLTLLRRLAVRASRTKRPRQTIGDWVELATPMGLKGAARQLLHEAFGVPRASYMQAIARSAEPVGLALARRRGRRSRTIDEEEAERLVDYVIQSAVMDASTCDPCAEADGLIFEYDDPEVDYYAPPYANCLGGENCRCVQIYVLNDGRQWVVREGRIR